MWVRGKNLKQRRGRPKTRGQSGGKVKKISVKSENFLVVRGTGLSHPLTRMTYPSVLERPIPALLEALE